jgi:hypothetical protein
MLTPHNPPSFYPWRNGWPFELSGGVSVPEDNGGKSLNPFRLIWRNDRQKNLQNSLFGSPFGVHISKT